MENVVELINVSKNFKKRIEKKVWFSNKNEIIYALKNITFSVKKGESIAIIGKNGSGKSTLLKILSGVYNQTSGIVKVNETINGILDSSIGFHKDLSGYDNILIQGKILGIPVNKLKKHINEIAEFAEIKDFLYTPIKHYSTGMAARLTFSVTTLSTAEILLFDEVLAFGDIHFQQKAYQHLKYINSKGKTIFITSHNLMGLIPICNRFILLDNGKIIADGSPEEVLKKYYEQAFYSFQYYYNKGNVQQEIIELNGIKITSIQYTINNDNLIFEMSVISDNINANDFDIGLLIRDFNGHAITMFSLKKNKVKIPSNFKVIRYTIPTDYININFLMIYPFIAYSKTNEFKLSSNPTVVKIEKQNFVTSQIDSIYSFIGQLNLPVEIEIS